MSPSAFTSPPVCPEPVSYTHLDVYKRQVVAPRNIERACICPRRRPRIVQLRVGQRSAIIEAAGNQDQPAGQHCRCVAITGYIQRTSIQMCIRDSHCRARIELLGQLGHELRRPAADYLRDEIYELRAKQGHVQYRMLYFFHDRDVVVLAHALTKEDEIPREMCIRDRWTGLAIY